MSENTITLSDTDATAVALVRFIRSEVNGLPKWAAYVETHDVSRDTVKDHALALATFAYPNLPTVQKKDGARTKFGNAVQAAANGLRRALPQVESDPKPATLRVSLSGEGGGTTVIEPSHPMYETVRALIGNDES